MPAGSDPPSAEVIDLPSEVLEHIAKFLDKRSLYVFMYAHPRIFEGCRKLTSVERIRTPILSDATRHFITMNASTVRSLNLSHCWSESECIKDVIQACPELIELDVINSSLTMEHLLEVLERLARIEELGVTLNKPEEATRPGLYPSIKTIHLELTTDYDERLFAVSFLKAFPQLKNLNINMFTRDRAPSDRLLPRNLNVEAMNQYERVILFTEERNAPALFSLFPEISHAIMPLHALPRHVHWLMRGEFSHLLSGESWVPGTLGYRYTELILPRGEIRLPDRYRDGQVGLAVRGSHPEFSFKMPPMNVFSSLLELDFTRCHTEYPAESWQFLVDSSPAVEALALPACCLFERQAVASELEIDVQILEVLQNLKLKKLHVDSKNSRCRKCCGTISRKFSQSLSGFKHLEELALHDLIFGANFFCSLGTPANVKIMKLMMTRPTGDSSEIFRDFKGFLASCRNLRHLKLTFSDLPIHRMQFWEALGDCNLEQLCLSTSILDLPDSTLLRSRLARLFENLDVFHVHAMAAGDREAYELDALIQQEVHKANLLRKSYVLHYINDYLSEYANFGTLGPDAVIKYPGRNMCFMENSISRLKPRGWDID